MIEVLQTVIDLLLFQTAIEVLFKFPTQVPNSRTVIEQVFYDVPIKKYDVKYDVPIYDFPAIPVFIFFKKFFLDVLFWKKFFKQGHTITTKLD